MPKTKTSNPDSGSSAIYLLSAFTTGRWTGALRVVMFTVVALLAVRTSLVPRRIAGLVVAVVLVGSAVMIAVSFINQAGDCARQSTAGPEPSVPCSA